MESSLGPLLPLFDRERAAGNAVAVGLLLHTAGSTYRKAGALMLIASNGDYAGLLSGGCLEGDLREHARTVLETGNAQVVTYDMRGGDDLIWGLGLGCEGAMTILLLRAGPDSNWQPLSHLARCLREHCPTAVGIVVESELKDLRPGSILLPTRPEHDLAHHRSGRSAPALSRQSSGDTPLPPGVAAVLDEAADTGRPGWFESEAPRWKLFALPLSLPPRLLLLGAGPDAVPVVELAARLNWKVTLVDHRAAYALAEHFPSAERVVRTQPGQWPVEVDTASVSAAVVMSHHLPSDLEYLRALARTQIPYIGLLGPVARRERLLADLGSDGDSLRSRLHAPVGLALGGRAPESVALAIVAQIHAFLHGAAHTTLDPVHGQTEPA